MSDAKGFLMNSRGPGPRTGLLHARMVVSSVLQHEPYQIPRFLTFPDQ